MITFDASKYDGYIFDCDGTLADTMPLHYKAWSETLDAKLGRTSDFTESMFYHYGGMPARQIVERLNRDYGYGLPVDEFAHEKEMRFVELLPGIGPVQEVVDVLNRLGPNAKVAVASGGLTEIVRKTLLFLGLSVGPKEKIKFLIGSDQVTHGKPNPELFLHAAKLLGVEPKRCLVFEDAEPGFQAAKAGGMDYIDVRPFRANMAAAGKYEAGL
jgi:beta-phosphoglucomutase-like phosphatase (HAD superfamily)